MSTATKMFRILRYLQLWRIDNIANYYLLKNESDSLEKDHETDRSSSDAESFDDPLSPLKKHSFKRNTALRSLGKLKVLLPSFLQETDPRSEPKPLRPTAWLDGLRGVAAFFVVLHHTTLIYFSWAIYNGWKDSNDHLIQLPIIRLMVSGRPNVMTFFVISGYALSLKPLSLIRKCQYAKVYATLASSTFRRHPRLYIPAMIICLPAPFITFWGGFAPADGMPGAAVSGTNPPRFDTLWEQLTDYKNAILTVSDFYFPNGAIWRYSDSLWTLPIEFRSSLVIFAMLLALSRFTNGSRILITLFVAAYSLWYLHWGELLFIGGMLIADRSVLAQRSLESRGSLSNDCYEPPHRFLCFSASRSSAARRMFSVVALIVVLFLLGMPEQGQGAADSYGYGYLSALIPEHYHKLGDPDRFWQPLGAILLVLVLDSSRFLQRPFTTRLAQYLGKISFSLYLVHMQLIHSLGFITARYFLEITGSESYWQYGAGIGLATLVTWIVTFWLADLGSRFVDAKAVQFTAWVYDKLSKRSIEGYG
ncbi:acyltransferase family-domain-containing protein [Xylariaceae sp. FL1019]|nr:acyltransferase family-domain-containing protein [Xylariaceae sp. FL1019]